MLPWEKRLLRGLAKTTGDAAISVARGNGKSALMAGICAAVVDPKGPLHRRAAEVVVVASTFRQSTTIYRDVVAYLGSGKYDLNDRREWRKSDTVNSAVLSHRATGSRVICIGSDPGPRFGMRPYIALCDEPAAWQGGGDAMLSAIRTGLGKTEGTRLIALGTRPSEESHWFAKMLDGGARFIQQHRAGKEDPPFQARTWAKANPSIMGGHFAHLKERIKLEAQEAKRDPSLMASFLALRLNLGTGDVLAATLLDAGCWTRIEGDALPEGKCYWGVDLGGNAASSAIAAYWPESGRLQAVAAFPNEPTLEQRGARDGVGNLYAEAARRGELYQFGGMSVDYGKLAEKALEVLGQPSAVAADRWRIADLVDGLRSGGIKSVPLEPRGQGFKDGGEDVRIFRKAAIEGRVTPVKSLFLTSCMAAARTLSDPSGNTKLSKATEGGRRLKARDDAAAAAILAVSLGARRTRTSKRSSGIYKGMQHEQKSPSSSVEPEGSLAGSDFCKGFLALSGVREGG